MSNKITWWPASLARDNTQPFVVLMRFDWPDGQRIYELGTYIPRSANPWVNALGESLPEAPDYFVPANKIVEFISIPADREYTYKVKV